MMRCVFPSAAQTCIVIIPTLCSGALVFGPELFMEPSENSEASAPRAKAQRPPGLLASVRREQSVMRRGTDTPSRVMLPTSDSGSRAARQSVTSARVSKVIDAFASVQELADRGVFAAPLQSALSFAAVPASNSSPATFMPASLQPEVASTIAPWRNRSSSAFPERMKAKVLRRDVVIPHGAPHPETSPATIAKPLLNVSGREWRNTTQPRRKKAVGLVQQKHEPSEVAEPLAVEETTATAPMSTYVDPDGAPHRFSKSTLVVVIAAKVLSMLCTVWVYVRKTWFFSASPANRDGTSATSSNSTPVLRFASGRTSDTNGRGSRSPAVRLGSRFMRKSMASPYPKMSALNNSEKTRRTRQLSQGASSLSFAS
mmetsp:Transcript_31551/g.86947  ORF Transcript_31551/g.86947 Transcript_31551/m.86947 type:complete len:371 (-) Transcript_31551:133-1245(-)